MKMIHRLYALVAGLAVSLVALPAFATAAPDYTTVTSAVDWTAVNTGILSIAAALAAVLVVKRGARILLSFIGR